MKHLMLLALLTGCGVDNAGLNQAADTLSKNQAPSGSVQNQPENSRETTIEYIKTGSERSLSIESTRDLPACGPQSSGTSAILKGSGQRFVCSESIWHESAPLSAPPEAVAAPEPPQEAAKAPPVAENTHRPLQVHEWSDVMTGTLWALGSLREPATLTSYPPCSGEYRLPTISELGLALAHGLDQKALSFPQVGGGLWTSDFVLAPDPVAANGSDGSYRAYMGLDGKLFNVSQYQTSARTFAVGIACIKG